MGSMNIGEMNALKKYLLAAWLMAILTLFSCLSSVARFIIGTGTGPEKTPEFQAASGSDSLRYHDMIITLLLPYIRESVQKVYADDVSITPDRVNIIRIERKGAFRTYDFLIRLEVRPIGYEGRSMGRDLITLKLSHDHEIELVDYESARDY